jgi:hypothetical protein
MTEPAQKTSNIPRKYKHSDDLLRKDWSKPLKTFIIPSSEGNRVRSFSRVVPAGIILRSEPWGAHPGTSLSEF